MKLCKTRRKDECLLKLQEDTHVNAWPLTIYSILVSSLSFWISIQTDYSLSCVICVFY